MNRVTPRCRTVRRATSWRASHHVIAMSPTPSARTPGSGHHVAAATPPRTVTIARTNSQRTARVGRKHPIQLEPLAGDRQHQERQPPEHDAENRRAAEPLHVADRPGQRADRHRRDEERRLPSPHDHEDRDHDEAAGR